ncbi:MAG: ECF transporter S component [Firmicutes bacterium]|nr:ECF transporter S component [Bacillota bacterium]
MEDRGRRRRGHFRLSDYVILAMLAAMGIASKAVIVPLAQAITGPLFIPGGVVAGGFFMMFLVLGTALTGRLGAALLVSFIQALLVTITGSFGSHGAASLFTYVLPGLAVEAWFFLSKHRGCCPLCCFIAGMIANMVGTFAVNLAIFRLPFVPLMLSIAVSALSGGLGGLVASSVARKLEKLEIL